MSYAIIRNEKYKRERLKFIYRHNKRLNRNYSNKNIDPNRINLNYSLKDTNMNFEKTFDNIKEEYKLKGQIKKVSNIACEYIITSSKEYFENAGEEETKRYFIESYNFVKEYKNLGEEYILSADVHMDEETPHMHLLFIPVVHTLDKKGNKIDKIACSEFWKEKDSYRQLQDNYYEYIKEKGFDLERGNKDSKIKHLDMETLKEVTKYYQTKELREENKKIKKENTYLKDKINELNNYINKILDVAINICKIPKNLFKTKLFNKGTKKIERL